MVATPELPSINNTTQTSSAVNGGNFSQSFSTGNFIADDGLNKNIIIIAIASFSLAIITFNIVKKWVLRMQSIAF